MKKKRIVVALLIVLFAAAGGAAACYTLDEPVIEFDRERYDDIVAEYGEPVALHQIGAVCRSRFFRRDGVPVPVTSDALPSPALPGTYTIRYSAAYQELTAEGSYAVRIVDTVPPVLTVDPQTYECACADNVDGDLTGAVETRTEGDQIIFTVTDSSGNTATQTVTRDVVPPVITFGDGLLDYRCVDETDGDLTERVTYYESDGYMCYEAEDNHGNRAEASRKIEGGNRVVYLTFDDGPGPCTAQLLDILKQYGVKATFFVVGSSKDVDILPRMAAEGHSIGAHAYRHDYKKIYSSAEAYFNDLAQVCQVIEEQTDVATTLIRFPGGGSNTVSRKYCKGIMSQLTKEVAERGYTYFDWNVSSGDAGQTTQTQTVISNVENGILGQHVAVVLQHDVKDFSVAGAEEIIRWGQAHGCVFLPLTERSTAPHHGVNN